MGWRMVILGPWQISTRVRLGPEEAGPGGKVEQPGVGVEAEVERGEVAEMEMLLPERLSILSLCLRSSLMLTRTFRASRLGAF